MKSAIRRLRRLEKKRKCESGGIWVCFDDGRAQNYATGEIRLRADLINECAAHLFISEADLRL